MIFGLTVSMGITVLSVLGAFLGLAGCMICDSVRSL